MSCWAAAEGLRRRGLDWAMPALEEWVHPVFAVRDEARRAALLAAWSGLQVARGQRVAILVGDRAEGDRLGDLVRRWFPGVHVWVGVGEGLWGREWEAIRTEEDVVILSYYQFLNVLSRWSRWGFYRVALWNADGWLRSARLAVLDVILDLLGRCRAQVRLCVVSPRLRESWVNWLMSRFRGVGVGGHEVVRVPRVEAVDVGGAGEGSSPLDFVEETNDACLVMQVAQLEEMKGLLLVTRARLRVLPLASRNGEAFKRVYLYVPNLDASDDDLVSWGRRVKPGGTLVLLYDGWAVEGTVTPQEVAQTTERRLGRLGGLVADGEQMQVRVQEFLVQFFRRVRYQSCLQDELAITYAGSQLGGSFVARCISALGQLSMTDLGLVERPRYHRTPRRVDSACTSSESKEQEEDTNAKRDECVVMAGWLRLTPLGREAAIQFRRLDVVVAVRRQSRGWRGLHDLMTAMQEEHQGSSSAEVLQQLIGGGKPPPNRVVDFSETKLVFRWRLEVAAFRTLHPKDEGLRRLEHAFRPSSAPERQRRLRGLAVMAVLVPYLYDLFVRGVAASEAADESRSAPHRAQYIHYRDLGHWLDASPDTVYRLLRCYLPSPAPQDLARLQYYFEARRRRSLGIRLCQQVEELAQVVDHAYLRLPGAGRPRRVLVRLSETPGGEKVLPSAFTAGCRDCVVYAPHRRVCALAWYVVHEIGLAALPSVLHDRDVRCAGQASPCDYFAPRQTSIPAALMQDVVCAPKEAFAGLRAYRCPILRCSGRVVFESKACLGICDTCGCQVKSTNSATGVEVKADRRRFLSQMVEHLTGIRGSVARGSPRTPAAEPSPLTLDPTTTMVQLEQEQLCWRIHLSAEEPEERHRELASISVILAPVEAVSNDVQRHLDAQGIRLLAYPTASNLSLTPDSGLLQGLSWAQRTPPLLATFGTGLFLTALAATAELSLFPGFTTAEVDTCLQREIDLFMDFVGCQRFGAVQWMGLEGRIARLHTDLVRRRLAARTEGAVAPHGRYLARKVPTDDARGRMRAAQSPFDEALNEAHRQIGWILRTENAAAGLGYFTPGWLFFHQRVPGKNAHLDLDEVARRVADNHVLTPFLHDEISSDDFVKQKDAFGFPAYGATASCIEKIHRLVQAILRCRVRYRRKPTDLLTAHRLAVANLRHALDHQDMQAYDPLVYLPVDALPQLVQEFLPLKTLVDHIHSRHNTSAPGSCWEYIERVLTTWKEATQ